MDFFGIGLPEIFFVLIIALIVMGPNDMVKAGRTLGRFLRRLVTSPSWQMVQQTSRELRYLPNKLMREAGLEDLKNEIPDRKKIRRDLGLDDINNEVNKDLNAWQKGLTDWTTPVSPTIGGPNVPAQADSAAGADPAATDDPAPQNPPEAKT